MEYYLLVLAIVISAPLKHNAFLNLWAIFTHRNRYFCHESDQRIQHNMVFSDIISNSLGKYPVAFPKKKVTLDGYPAYEFQRQSGGNILICSHYMKMYWLGVILKCELKLYSMCLLSTWHGLLPNSYTLCFDCTAPAIINVYSIAF